MRISRLKSCNISTSLRLGYSNVIFSNLIVPRRMGSNVIPDVGGMAGRRSRRSKIRVPAPIPRMIEDWINRIGSHAGATRQFKTYKERPVGKPLPRLVSPAERANITYVSICNPLPTYTVYRSNDVKSPTDISPRVTRVPPGSTIQNFTLRL